MPYNFEFREGEVFICPPNVDFDEINFSDDFECRILCISDHLIQGVLRNKADVWHHAVYINQPNIFNISAVSQEEFKHYYTLIRSKLTNHDDALPKEILLSVVRAFLLELCHYLEGTRNIDRGQKLSQGKLLFNKFISLLSSSDVKRQPITVYASELAITPKYLTMLCLHVS